MINIAIFARDINGKEIYGYTSYPMPELKILSLSSKTTVSIKNAYEIKDELKKTGFKWESFDKAWEIEVKTEDAFNKLMAELHDKFELIYTVVDQREYDENKEYFQEVFPEHKIYKYNQQERNWAVK